MKRRLKKNPFKSYTSSNAGGGTCLQISSRLLAVRWVWAERGIMDRLLASGQQSYLSEWACLWQGQGQVKQVLRAGLLYFASARADQQNRVKCERARNTSQDRGDKEQGKSCECGNGKASSGKRRHNNTHAQEEATFSFALSSPLPKVAFIGGWLAGLKDR